jgi:uncharacterized surface protein with fasciclin (FAS1) repeats
MFAGLSLPSLLAEGNFPAFAGEFDSTYYIHTTAVDAAVIRSSPTFQELRAVMRVKLVTHHPRVFGHAVETHTRIWLDGFESARRRGSFIAALPADMVWADGAFRSVASALLAGKKAIYAMFIRVVSETFVEEYSPQAGPAGGASISPRALMGLVMRHIHPLHASYLRDGGNFPFHAEYTLWPVDREGFVMRSLATTTLLFQAAEYAVNSQFSLSEVKAPDEVGFMTDSDEICGVSLTPLQKDVDWYFHERPADLDEIGAWWINFDGPAHAALASRHFRFHTGDFTEARWREVERQSDFFVAQALTAREMIRVGRALRAEGCDAAAQCLATALYAARLRRYWRWSGPVTVFAPVDTGLDAWPERQLQELLAPGNERALREMIFSHVVSGVVDPVRVTTTTTVNGLRLEFAQAPHAVTVNGKNLLSRTELAHGSVLFLIEAPLSP